MTVKGMICGSPRIHTLCRIEEVVEEVADRHRLHSSCTSPRPSEPTNASSRLCIRAMTTAAKQPRMRKRELAAACSRSGCRAARRPARPAWCRSSTTRPRRRSVLMPTEPGHRRRVDGRPDRQPEGRRPQQEREQDARPRARRRRRPRRRSSRCRRRTPRTGAVGRRPRSAPRSGRRARRSSVTSGGSATHNPMVDTSRTDGRRGREPPEQHGPEQRGRAAARSTSTVTTAATRASTRARRSARRR